MPRGRQYYNPLTTTPETVQGETDYRRIELFPAGAESLARLPQEQGKWIGRRIAYDGSIAEEAPGDFDHDTALAQATSLWPGLMVYELNAENEDSTWDGIGPSPRIWQNVQAVQQAVEADPGRSATEVAELIRADAFPPAVNTALADGLTEEEARTAGRIVHALVAPLPGSYVRLQDIALLLEDYAVQYDEEKNPSAAMALRAAAEALKEVG